PSAWAWPAPDRTAAIWPRCCARPTQRCTTRSRAAATASPASRGRIRPRYGFETGPNVGFEVGSSNLEQGCDLQLPASDTRLPLPRTWEPHDPRHRSDRNDRQRAAPPARGTRAESARLLAQPREAAPAAGAGAFP